MSSLPTFCPVVPSIAQSPPTCYFSLCTGIFESGPIGQGVSDPEKKRKIIGNTFIEIFEDEAKKINENVDLIVTYAGMDEKFFKYSVDSGVDGIVVAALGVGNVPPKVFDGIGYALSNNIPVVLVSRCPAGETLDIYSYPGAGKWLKKAGVIFADYLNGQKARIKLIIALGITKDYNKLVEIFE